MTSTIQQTVVNPNTSVLLLNTDILPNNSNIVVLLSNTNLPGRSVTIRDTTGNLSSTKLIIVSTTNGIHFLDGTNSITLNQPNAFVTVANRDPETWVVQNTFAFPAESSSANVNSVTANYIIASTIQAELIFSTTQMIVSSFLVENVVGANDFNSFGNLYVGSTFFAFNTRGNAAIQASLRVVSTISTGGSVFVGENLSTVSSASFGGHAFIGGSLSTQGSLYVSGGITAMRPTFLSSLSTIGDIGFGSDVLMTRNILYASTVSTLATESRTVSTGSLFAFQTILNNLSTVGPNIGIGADILMTRNTITASSTIANSMTASNLLQTSSVFTSSLTVFNVANFSTISTSGVATFENGAFFNSTIFAKDLSISSLLVLGNLQAGSTVLSSLFVSDNTTVFNFSTIQTASFGGSLFVNLGSIEGARALLSTATISNVLRAERISTTNLSASNTIQVGSNAGRTIITLSSISTTFYRGAQAAFSSIAGDGSGLFNLNAISTPSLTSTVAGLGQIYASTIAAGVNVEQLVSTNVGLGSLGYISAGQAISGYITPQEIEIGVSTLELTASNIFASNQFHINVPGFAPNPAIKIEALAGGPIYQLFNSGGTNQLQVGVDGNGNATIRSEWPFTQAQPLGLFGSIVSVTGQEFQVTQLGQDIQPLTRITSSVISTTTIVADRGEFGLLFGDARNLSNLPLSSFLGTVSSGLSTVALFTSNTSNYLVNTYQGFSTAVSTVAQYTSNTSNYLLNNYQGFSTAVSTVAEYTSNTSNYLLNNYQGFSTAVSTVALFTSNTSNYSKGILQDYSTSVSSVALYTSNTSNYLVNTYQGFSTAISTVAQFTSNTSNFFKGAFLDLSTSVSTMQLVASSIGINCNTAQFALDVAGTGRFLTVSSQSMTVSSLGINCNAPSFALDIVGALRVSTISTNTIRADASLMYNFPPISVWQFIGPVNGIPTTPISVQTAFTYTGDYQNYVVPADTTHIYIVGWGAAGRGTTVNGVSGGGGGACVKGFLPVTPGETLRIIVGLGGDSNITIPTDQQGAGGGGPSPGGGRTAIQRVNGTDILTIGGGGGGGGDNDEPGGGGSALSSAGQQGANGSRLTTNNGNHGGGGGQTVGGTGGNTPPSSGNAGETGSLQQGGKCATNGNAGGGGGYYGGGGGGYFVDTLTRAGAGGGGSSLTINLLRYSLELYDAVGKTPGNSTDPLRTGNVAEGNDGIEPRNGGHGILYITAWN